MSGKVRINQATFPCKDGKDGVIAVFLYGGDEDPKHILDAAIASYVEGCDDYSVWVDARLNNPWARVVISGIDRMESMSFAEAMTIITRDRKIDEILGEE